MKEALDANRLRRMGLPGIILGLGIHPFFASWVKTYGARIYDLTATVAFIGEIVLFGLILSSATTYIYYIYEGFRLPLLTRAARGWNERRLRRTVDALRELYASRTRDNLGPTERELATELTERLADFPLLETDEGLHPTVERPTLLGNIIATYELYSLTRYKIDGRTYWHQILSCAPESIRKDFDDSMSFAESLLLASAASFLVSIVAVLVLVGLFFGNLSERLAVATVALSPTAGTTLFVAGLLGWWIFYQLAITAHREVASVFRALVDVAMDDFVSWLTRVSLPSTPMAPRAAAVAEYLNFGVRMKEVVPHSATPHRPSTPQKDPPNLPGSHETA